MITNNERRNFLEKICNYTYVAIGATLINEILTKNTKIKFINEKFFAMGTNGKIQAFVNNIDEGKTISQKAIERIKRIEQLASKFAPDADIALINKYYRDYIAISEDTVNILETGIKYNKLTEGYFDIGLGNILTLANIDKNIPINGSFLKKNDFKKDIIKIKKNKVKIERDNTSLDLGGIAKGYALDEAMKIFKSNKIEHVAIELGGDIIVHGGLPSKMPWIIKLDEKITSVSNIDNFLKLNSGSIAVSGGYIKKSQKNTIFKHHIINPKQLKSEDKYIATIVYGENSMICDILSTATYNMKNEEIKKIQKLFKNYEILTYKNK